MSTHNMPGVGYEEITKVDGFSVRQYTGYELNTDDTVRVAIPGLEDLAFWANVVHEGYESTVEVREWGTQRTFYVDRSNITFEMIHECECGAYGGHSWRICHPDA